MTNLFTTPVDTPVVIHGAPVVYIEGPADVVASDNQGNTYTHNPQCSTCAKDALYEILDAVGIDALDDVDLSTVIISEGVIQINAPFGEATEQIEFDRLARTALLKRYHRYFSSNNQVAQASYHELDGTPIGRFEYVYATDSADIAARYGVEFDGGFAFCVAERPSGVRITRYYQTSYLQGLTGVNEFNNGF